jgi:glycosyltransferase involved in cell wall biosynthesis
LVLIGKEGIGSDKVLEKVKKSPNNQDIIMPGWVVGEDLPFLMNSTEVFIYPSLYEGFGMPVLEAFACATSIVVSKGSSLEEIAKSGALYCEADNSKSIAEAIKVLIEDKNMANEKKEQGLEIVKNFAWEKSAEKTWHILNS